MFVLIKKSDKSIAQKWSVLPRRVNIPGTNDCVMGATAPFDIGPDHVLREATVVDPAYDPDTQVRTGPVFDVVDDTFDVTETYAVRAKTAQEIADDQQTADIDELRLSVDKLAFIQTELIDKLLGQGTVQAADFTAPVRAIYQDIKVIVDRAKPT